NPTFLKRTRECCHGFEQVLKSCISKFADRKLTMSTSKPFAIVATRSRLQNMQESIGAI
ncbi:hypothetical protein V5799_012596, partial [Amblyomma americanum]